VKIKILLVIILIFVFCIGGTAFAMTDFERQTLIQQIQAQLNQLIQLLNEMLAQQQGTETWSHTFNNNLGYGSSGADEVINLHLALQKENISYAPDDINIFSTGTVRAVAEFQEKYASEILAPWGLTHGTGFVGKTTRAKLNSLYGIALTPQQQQQQVTTCTPSWSCGNWSFCVNNSQARTCTDSNNCGTTSGKPAITQSCACTPNWSCTNWSTCANSTQTKTCTDLNNCGVLTNKPATTQSCVNACTEHWQCAGWSNCIFTDAYGNGTQTKTCTDTNNCGTTANKPATTQTCIVSYTIDKKIMGTSVGDAETKKPMFSVRNHETGEFVRNPNNWAKDWNLSATSVDSSQMYGGIYTRAPGTLISPRHVVMAHHAGPPVGTVYKFVDMNNNVISRTLVDAKQIITSDMATDIEIGILDSDVPASFGFAKVLPSDWLNYIPRIQGAPYLGSADNVRIPLLSSDQTLRALVRDFWFGISETRMNNVTAEESNVARYALTDRVISGDSGFPSFLIVNNELVLLFLYQYGGLGANGGGPAISYYKTEINTAMANLQGGSNPYQLTVVDLSGYPMY